MGLLTAWRRQASWLAAQELAAVRLVAGADVPADPHVDTDVLGPEVAAALALAPGTALDRIAVARSLAAELAPTGEALAAGRITLVHALRVDEALTGKDPDVVAAVQAAVLPNPGAQSPAELGRSLRSAVAAADPATVEELHAEAARTRHVALYPEPDGMATLRARLFATDAALVYRALTRDAHASRRADRAAGQPRSEDLGLDARRADALVLLARRSFAGPDFPGRPRSRSALWWTCRPCLGSSTVPGT